MQAAIVSAKLPHLDQWTATRQHNAKTYDQLFSELGITQIGLPRVATDRHIFNQYVIRVSQRDALQAALQQDGIGTEVYYPVPMHLQECFSYLGHSVGTYPESERAAKQTLALPIYPELSEAQLRYVVDCVRSFFANGLMTEDPFKQTVTEAAPIPAVQRR
jgi:dTDP-4-amino-4,6-dideoxygalactose transaminase